MDELKACPFCGGEAKITGHFNGGTGNSWEVVECTQCGVAQPVTKYYSHQQAIDEWNRRAEPENKPLDSEPAYQETENFIQNKFGYCFYTLESYPFIYNLYVHPQYRRHGHSRILLGLVIGEIRKSGYDGEIRIQAKPKEGSIGLDDLTKYYQSMGLTIYEARKLEGSEL